MTVAAPVSLPPGRARPGFFRDHLGWYRTLRPVPFVAGISVEGLVLGLAAAFIGQWVFPSHERTDLSADPWEFLGYACVLAPLKETFLFQLLPILVLRRLHARWWVGLLVSTCLFIWAHASLGPTAAISAGLIGGFYFAFTYDHFAATRSHWLAYGATAISHGFHNFAVFAILLSVGKFDAPTYARVSTGGLDVVYITGVDGKFQAAVAAESIGHIFDTSGAKIYGPFRVITLSWTWQARLESGRIWFEGKSFELSDGQFFYLGLDPRRGATVWQLRVPLDAERFSTDPAGAVTDAVRRMAPATRAAQ